MASLGFFGFKQRHVECDLTLPDRRVRRLGLLDPDVHVARLQCWQLQGECQREWLCVVLANQLVERNFLHTQIVLGCNLLGNHQVVPGLRFAGIGDGGGANLKVAFGRRELLGHRGLLGFYKGQAVLRGQHVKVALANTHDQVLIGALQLGLGQIKLLDALLVAGPVGRAVKWLRRADGGALRSEGAVAAGAQIGDDFLRRT